jgi:hypothetical protein
MINKPSLRRGDLGVLVLAAAFFSAKLHAAPVQFIIDPSKSSVALSGYVGSATTPLTEQGPGSLTTSYSGTIVADVGSAGIQFTGGSTITAQTNGVWNPGVGGKGASAPADYGGQATLLGLPVKGALRNLVLDVTTGVLPVANGQFDASPLVFGFLNNSTASFDYDAGVFLGTGAIALSGDSTNKIGSIGTFSTVGGVPTLSIQIDTTFAFNKLVSGSLHLTGNLVATQGASTPSITSIQVQAQNVTLNVQGASPTASVQASSDLRAWNPQAATRTDNSSGAAFTFPASGPRGYYQVKQ